MGSRARRVSSPRRRSRPRRGPHGPTADSRARRLLRRRSPRSSYPSSSSVLLIARRLRDRHVVGQGRPAGRAHATSRLLRVRRTEPGRLTLGRADGQLVAAEPRQSAIVVGPTQTGKTTGFAIPAILEWQGPVVATSIKTDLLRETIAARSAITGARTFVYDPTGSTGLPSAGWTPLIEVPHLAGRAARRRMARPAARDRAARRARPPTSGTEPRPSCSRRSSSPPPAAAARWRRSSRWVDSQDDEPRRASARSRTTRRRRSTRSRRSRSGTTERRGSVYATAQTVLIAYADPGVLASAMSSELRADRLLDGGWHTAYLCAPAHEQRRLQPLFATLVQEIIAHAYDRTTETGQAARPAAAARPRRVRQHRAAPRPRNARLDRRRPGHPARLGLPGHGPDLRRLRARPRADDRLEPPREGDPLRHRGSSDARVRRAGCSATRRCRSLRRPRATHGHSTTESVSFRHLAPANVLREMRPGQGVLVYGHLAPARIALRPWFKDRRLRRLARTPELVASRRRYRERHPRGPDHALAEAAREAARGARPRRAARAAR